MFTEKEIYQHVDHLLSSMSLLTPALQLHVLWEAQSRIQHNLLMEELEETEKAIRRDFSNEATHS